ncbi:MAG: GNAT family N-acetyltransferase [Thermomicrobia bacterium]|nr:GNAT family N-acetyltransferase [Thermomicrobia bacterium]
MNRSRLMRIDTTRAEDLTHTDQDELRALTIAVYSPAVVATLPATQITWAPTVWSIRVRDDDDRLVSHVGMLTRVVSVNGLPTTVGGIGGVKTHPDARGRGYAAAALRTATAFLTDECGVAFALLVCLPTTVAYYERLGWQQFPGTLLIAQPGGTIPFTTNLPMVLPARAAVPLDGTINLCGYPW